MPSWKKVIVSGSSPTLNELTLSGDANLAPTNKLNFDGDGGHTYIHEQSDDNLLFKVGNQNMLVMVEGSTDYVRVPDSVRLSAGSSNDLQMVHDGTNSSLLNNTGDLTISNLVDDKDIILKSDDGSGGTTPYITIDGSATLTNFDKATRHLDSVISYFGTGLDGRIYHDGNNFYIAQVTTGDLYIQNELNDKDVILRSDDGSGGLAAYITLDGSAGTVEIGKATNVDGTLTSTGDVVAFYSSDERLKDNITNIHKPLAKIDKIGGYKFTWNDKQDTYLGKDVGVLAQEIEAIMPEVVTTRKNGYKAVKYDKLVPLLIEGIKELDKKIKDIEKNCDCLKK
tara:strand:+ start:7432 stop:8448 length:1017 start_codon:yes stop_codon:yes gene_type:complete